MRYDKIRGWVDEEVSSNNTWFEKIQAVLAWSESNPKFDPTFIKSLEIRMQARGTLTAPQEVALDNIIEKFHINVEEYL